MPDKGDTMTEPEKKDIPGEPEEILRGPRQIKIKRALVSVSDKHGLEDLIHELDSYGIEILSTGGTAKAIKEAGFNVTDLSSFTGFPEILDGRVKTLNPKVHGALLGRRDKDEHVKQMQQNEIDHIDLVIVNLYPFRETVAQGADFDACLENIDIGGPAMIRAAAKNHEFVTIVTDPGDYSALKEELKKHDGATTLALRRKLAANAYAHTASYDSAVATWFSGQVQEDAYPRYISFSGRRTLNLRYGENPHQQAALYSDGSDRPGVVTASQLQGKELSYNNLNDTDAAFQLVAEFDEPAVAIIKHANPSGVATGKDTLEAYKKALACDPLSAFGGIIALNQPLKAETAEEIIKTFCEVIIAPSIEPGAIDVLKSKEKVRVLTTGGMPEREQHIWQAKSILGGLLVQNMDTKALNNDDLNIVSDRSPTDPEMEDLIFAFKVCKHVKSNAIVFAKNKATVGIGAGQMSRLDSVKIAVSKAKDAEKAMQDALKDPDDEVESLLKGSVMASDAFFPFPDAMLAGADAGATAVIHPGGSIKDDDVIEAADDRGLAMVVTGQRHFRH